MSLILVLLRKNIQNLEFTEEKLPSLCGGINYEMKSKMLLFQKDWHRCYKLDATTG
ncbi:hypothetical protein [Flavobacterium sp. XS2P39]|uniref:hypothetical protein n=1 Tax=Flavobacterium sp. XS2P39 TaxID=3401725 RepID=UPI003AAE6628